jgi:CBS domain-containing protein
MLNPPVREVMCEKVVMVEETDSLLDANMLFVSHNLRHLPVIRGGALVGVVTHRDVKQYAPSLLTNVSQDEYNRVMETTPVSRIMTRHVVTIGPDELVYQAAKVMHTRRIGCLPVVEGNKVVGIVTASDLLGFLARLLQVPAKPE